MSIIEEYKEKAGRYEEDLQLLIRYHFEREILSYLSDKGVDKNLVFQGGTSLKIAYGSPRFSVDLDFVRTPVGDDDLKRLCDGLDRYLKERYPDFDFELKVQKDTPDLQRVILKISHPSFPNKVKIPIEKFNVLAYTREKHKDDEMVLTVEAQEELMADKIVALMFRKFVKAGDVYDLYYLAERGVKPNIYLIRFKINDYGETLSRDTVENAIERLREAKNELPDRFRRYFIHEDWERITAYLDEIIEKDIEILKSVERELFPEKELEDENEEEMEIGG